MPGGNLWRQCLILGFHRAIVAVTLECKCQAPVCAIRAWRASVSTSKYRFHDPLVIGDTKSAGTESHDFQPWYHLDNKISLDMRAFCPWGCVSERVKLELLTVTSPLTGCYLHWREPLTCNNTAPGHIHQISHQGPRWTDLTAGLDAEAGRGNQGRASTGKWGAGASILLYGDTMNSWVSSNLPEKGISVE